MNTKHLWLRFTFLAALVGICLLPLATGRGLRWGIDLRGGHSLVFEIRTTESERDQLLARKKQLEADLAAATTEQQRKEIQGTIERLDVELGRLAGQGDPGDLTLRMIANLKRRVDPNGLRALEWRPLSGNRFEVRMPAGKGDAKQKREAYFRAMDRLEDGNIQPEEVRQVLQLPPDKQQARIDQLTKGDQAQRQRFATLLEAYRKLSSARAARDAAVENRRKAIDQGATAEQLKALDEAIAAAEAALDDAQIDFESARDALQEGNISRQELHLALENRYLQRIAQAEGAQADAAAGRRRKQFSDDLVIEELDIGARQYETNIDNILKRYPARAEEIKEVIDLFEQWSKVRERLEDPADLIRLIAKAGVLEFRIAPRMPAGGESGSSIELTEEEYQRYVNSLRTEGPEALRNRNAPLQWFPIHGSSAGGTKRYILLYNQPGYQMLQERRGAWQLTSAEQTVDENGRPAIRFNLNEAGARRMAKLTTDHQTHPLAILLDDEVYCAPVIREKAIISRSGIITGVPVEEIDDLVQTLNAGSLPARLNPVPVSTNNFGPSIGAVNRDLGYKAARWGLIIVAAFMLVYYLLSGAIADFALLLNVTLILGTMSWFGAVFTLPGIAGLILTIGIAVDANVLIFERLREEQAKGQTIRMALKNAYERAFSAIFDANITTLLTCLILGWVGTKEVRGFAITLGLGVAYSMFTALVVTRWVFQLLLDAKLLKKPLPMLRIIGVPKINWMSKRHFFWGLSILFVALGIASLVRQGNDIWGIEFSSGTQAIITFKDDALLKDPVTGQASLPDDAAVRDRFKEVAGRLGYDKLQATATVETRLDPNRVRNFINRYDDSALPDGKVSRQEWQAAGMNPACFAKLDADGNGELTEEELATTLPSSMYQVSTTETDVAKIRRVARDAFGDALKISAERDFKLVTGEAAPELGITMPPNGKLRITASTARQVQAAYRDELTGAEGGVLLVVKDVTPPMSSGELSERIRDMRGQPDYASQIFSKTKVIGLTRADEDTFSSFAVIVIPADPGALDRPAAWNEFADGEATLLSDALARGTAMPVSNFDAAIAGEMAQRAIMAVVLSWLSIVVYLWFRFGSVQWGLAAVICLIHDVIIVVGLVAASSWISTTAVGQALGIQSFKIDLAMVAAFLTVIGYSVNDTIVIFDRIRENRGKLKTVSGQVINASINQTLSRTLLTTGTTFIVVIVMYVMGGAGLHAFNYALLIGILFGTYSSVAVASPLLMGFKKAVVTKVVNPVEAD